MYIHIGKEISIQASWIVAVLDLDKASEYSQDLREYLLNMEKIGKLQWLGPQIPRSIIIALDRVYLSPVSVETLRQRFDQKYYQSELKEYHE